MSRAMKFNIIQTTCWTIVAIIMLYIFFSGNTINEWGDNRLKTISLAVLFVLGFGTDFIVRTLGRTEKYKVIRDERDKDIQNKSLSFAFVIVVLYIYLLSIGLYLYYEEAGYLPIGWVWFIAYSLIVAANLAAGYCSLYNYKKQGM